MGCDIHLHVEIKLEGVEGWQHLSMPRVPRSYLLFAHMAGVRNSETNPVIPIAELRGIPTDASPVTAFDLQRWEGDAHSTSWLSAEEIAALAVRMEREYEQPPLSRRWDESQALGGCFFGNSFSDPREEWPQGVVDLRFVFFFDN